MMSSKLIGCSVAGVVALFSASALADEPSSGSSWSGSTTTTTTPSTTTTTTASSTNAGAATAEKDDGTADHDKFVGHFAVGYLGATDIPLPTPKGATGTVSAPTVGVRYWLNKRIGIDGGLGIGLSGGSTEGPGPNGTTLVTDAASRLGVLIHGGVPIALVRGKHYTFEVIPELNIGFASSTIKATAPNAPDTSLSGIRLDIGARAGAEIHFGFIGVPELALQATVGLQLALQSQKTTAGSVTSSTSSNSIGTTVQADPWSLFSKNIAALYYF